MWRMHPSIQRSEFSHFYSSSFFFSKGGKEGWEGGGRGLKPPPSERNVKTGLILGFDWIQVYDTE